MVPARLSAALSGIHTIKEQQSCRGKNPVEACALVACFPTFLHECLCVVVARDTKGSGDGAGQLSSGWKAAKCWL